MNERSDFLYVRPSFLTGVARSIDLGGTINQYNNSPSGEEADDTALRMDWGVVGQDIRRAMASVTRLPQTAGLTMAFKLVRMAEQRWRRLDAPHLVAQVRGPQTPEGR